jgi:hypothetical protein
MFNFKTSCSSGATTSGDFEGRRATQGLVQVMTRRALLGLFVAVMTVLALPGVSRAQVLYGSLNGTVTDQKNDAIPGVRVEIVNTRTAELKATVTDDRGGYAFSNLQVGEYKITIKHTSFKTKILEGIHVEANKVFRYDAQLEVGELRETVVVTSEANPQLQTDRTDVNITQTARQVNDLPLTGSLGRNYQSMMILVPGAVSAGEQNSAAGNPQRSISFNVNGVSRLQNNTRIDGAGVVYPWLPTNTAYRPPNQSRPSTLSPTRSTRNGDFRFCRQLTIKSGRMIFWGRGVTTRTARLRRVAFSKRRRGSPGHSAQFGYAVSVLNSKIGNRKKC